MTRLLSILPRPRAFALGGRAWPVSPLRLRDIAAIEAWLSSRVASPIDGARAAIMGMGEGRDRDRLVREAFLAQEEWPPRFGSPEADRLSETEDGAKFLLALILGRHTPTISAADVDTVYEAITAAEYESLRRFAFGIDPLDELARYIDGPIDRGPADKPLDWGKCFVALAKLYPWLDLEKFADLTLAQFVILRSEGEHEPAGYRPGEDIMAFAARRRAFFGGDGE